MFAIYFEYAVYCSITDGYLGTRVASPFEGRRTRRDGRDGSHTERRQPYVYETAALAEYFAAKRTGQYDGEHRYFVVECRTGRKLSELQPYATSPDCINYGYVPTLDADSPF